MAHLVRTVRSRPRPSRANVAGAAGLILGLLVVAFLWMRSGVSPSRGAERLRDSKPLGDAAPLDAPKRTEADRRVVVPVEAATSTRILALDERGAVIEGAVIYARAGGKWSERGRTDRMGELELDLVRTLEIDFVGRASGFTPVRASSQPPHPGRLELVFTPGDRICGVVRTSRGVPPSAPVRVIVFSRESALEALIPRVTRLTEGDPSFLLAVTDSDGAFCIEGVNAGELYSLACGGAGYATRGGVRTARAGEQHVSIEVTRLFGAGVQFVDRTGRREIRSLAHRTLEGWCEEPGSRFRGSVDAIDVYLAGVDPNWGPVPRGMLLWFFESDSEAASVGPVRLDHELAGYAAGVERFPAGIVSGEIPIHVVPLDDGFFERGVLEVVFTTKAGSDEQSRVRVPHNGNLELSTESGAVWQFAVAPDAEGKALIEDVPGGRYGARFVSQPFVHPPRSEPPVTLDVLDGTNRLEVPLTGAGWIRFELSDSTGAPYAGLVQLMLVRGELETQTQSKPGARLVAGRGIRPPYIVEGLEPGRYRAMLILPSFAPPTSGGALIVDVRADAESVIRASRSH